MPARGTHGSQPENLVIANSVRGGATRVIERGAMLPATPGRPFDEESTPWRPWSPGQVTEQLSHLHGLGRSIRWAVAGGWAIDLYLGRITRSHEDLEIAVLSSDAPTVLAAFTEPAWRWEIPMDGHLYPRNSAAFTQTNQTWLWSQKEHGFVLDVFRERHDGDTWICRRDETIRRAWSELVCMGHAGTPYMTPETVLLFKAKYSRAKDILDLEAVLPSLENHRRAWLRSALQRIHPGHAWLAAL
jgi:hypothetical protein